MIFKYIILIYGIAQFLFGAYIWFTRNESLGKILIGLFSIGFSTIKYEDIKNTRVFARWVGGIVILWGCTYIFLASAAMYFQIGVVMTILLIILIETTFFKLLISGVKDFI